MIDLIMYLEDLKRNGHIRSYRIIKGHVVITPTTPVKYIDIKGKLIEP